MTYSDQSSDNDISCDVVGTSLQATSVNNVYMGESAKPRWLKVLQYAAVPVAVAVTAVTVTAVRSASPSDPVEEAPIAATSSVPAGTTTSAPPAPVPVPHAQAARPTQAAAVPRAPAGATTTTIPLATTTVPKPSALAPAGDGVRFSGALRFASFHLDPVPPRDVPESNVWALTPTRLHGDPGYWLAEWFTEGVPGRDDCQAHLATNATLDADNVVVGSRVCGRTPESRIFRIDVTALDGGAITGQVTVWEAA
ncbi:hypothetical protein [Lentzea sp. NPDC055074]